jgi:uncharacterized protein
MPLLSRILSLLVLLFGLLLPGAPAWAVAAADFPASAPTSNVLDGAEVLSRATVTDLENKLLSFEEAHVQARLVTLRRLDYGLSLAELGDQLLQRWQSPDDAQIVLLIETKSNSAAIRGDQEAERLLPQSLLTNTAETTMADPLRVPSLPVPRTQAPPPRPRRLLLSAMFQAQRKPPPAMPAPG